MRIKNVDALTDFFLESNAYELNKMFAQIRTFIFQMKLKMFIKPIRKYGKLQYSNIRN